jgi:superoxide dismutase, Fe-Mn family
MEYTPRSFTIPQLDGISEKSVEEHLGLYAGYVKNFNAMSALLTEYAQDSTKHAHALSELIRRRSFEFDGMRLHELYFEQLEHSGAALSLESAFAVALAQEYGSVESFVQMFRAIALMRGPGWALLYWDPLAKQFLTGFSGEQHQGHFATLPIILALDVWEHAFLLDYGAQGKGSYVDAFFKNLNWGVIEQRFASHTR